MKWWDSWSIVNVNAYTCTSNFFIKLDRHGPTACNADCWAAVYSGLYQLPQDRNNAVSRELWSCVRLWKLECIFIFTNLFVILEILYVGEKEFSIESSMIFFTFTEMYTCILIEDLNGCLYVSRSMITLLNYMYAWFYSWLHFNLYILLWLWYLMYTSLYNEFLVLNDVFFSFFQRHSSSAGFKLYVGRLCSKSTERGNSETKVCCQN